MGFWNKTISLFRNETQEYTIDTNPTTEDINRFFDTDINISGSKLNSVSYYSCMQIRCNAIAKLPIKLMKEEGRGIEKDTTHNLYKLLKNRPNPFTNSHDFLWATEFQRLEHGNAYWVMDIQKGTIRSIYLIDSSKVSIIIDNTGILNKKNAVYYIYNDSGLGTLIYNSNNIVHFKNFSKNGLEGTSIKKYLSDVISNEQYSNKILNDKYRTGLQDPVVVEYTGDLNGTKQNQIKKRFADLGGAKNAGKVIPIPTDFKIHQLETKLVNNQFFQLQGLTTRHIANAFGVKGFQLNDMEKSTYNNIEQQNKAFYSDTLQNVLTTYEQEMEYKLLTTKELSDGYYIKFNVDSILRSDLPVRTASYATGITTGYMTIAEARAKEDLPYIEGTDKLVIGNGASRYLDDLGKAYNKGDKGENT